MENVVEKETNQVLKGSEFIVKDSIPADVFTPEDTNEEQDMIRNMVKDFVREEVESRYPDVEKQKDNISKTILGTAGELGILGAHIPEEYGGMPMSTNTGSIIAEEIGYAGSFSVTVSAHTGIGMLPLLYFGTEEQKKKYLPGLSSGQLAASYCLTEPSSGSDALAAKTKAIPTEDGEHYLLTGQKMWITNAGFADVFIVFAQVDGDKFTCFLVEKGAEGLSLGAEEDKLGIKGSSTRQVFFENVKVHKSSLLGEIGKGHLIAFNVLNIGRLKLGIMALGSAKRNFDVGIKYANERHQFKQPISNFGAIQYKIAEQCIRIYACEAALYRTSMLLQLKAQALFDAGATYGEAKLQAAEEYAVECAMLKVVGSEMLDYVVDETVQIHGGYGFSEEYEAARQYRDSRINRIFEGTNEINRLLSVAMTLKRAAKGHIDLVGPAWAVQKELMAMPTASKTEGTYGTEVDTVKNMKKILLMVAGAAAKAQMDGHLNLKMEQMITMNIADVMMDVFVCESLLLRVQKIADKGGDVTLPTHILEVFLYDAVDRIAKNAKDALCSFAEGEPLRMMLMGIKRFAKYKNVNVRDARRAIAKPVIEGNAYCY